MKQIRIFLQSTVLIFAGIASVQGIASAAAASVPAAQQSQPPPTLASTVDREISTIEKQIVEAAEAMPEDKFNFSPESLDIPGDDYKGVRTFALQVKHVAASNYFLFSAITGDKIPDNFKGGNGPQDLKTKADILQFLKDSFAMGHRAAATLTTQNILEASETSKSPRLHLATFAVAHAFDHYGQMVEYLRMNGVVPPASAPQAQQSQRASGASVVDPKAPQGAGQGQPQNQATPPARSRADETLEWWNQIGNKLIAMAKDFPEDKYDFRLQKDERTFAENLLHVAAVDYDLIGRVSESNRGPDFGKDKHNPSRDVYKTKADVVKLIEQAVTDGAAVIQQQGDAGLDKTTPFGWETGKHVVHNSYIWITAIEHSTEHFGQLVVYYRANNLVPPESRR
jgi:uncharacterized damage-inducible protein DinB